MDFIVPLCLNIKCAGWKGPQSGDVSCLLLEFRLIRAVLTSFVFPPRWYVRSAFPWWAGERHWPWHDADHREPPPVPQHLPCALAGVSVWDGNGIKFPAHQGESWASGRKSSYRSVSSSTVKDKSTVIYTFLLIHCFEERKKTALTQDISEIQGVIRTHTHSKHIICDLDIPKPVVIALYDLQSES